MEDKVTEKSEKVDIRKLNHVQRAEILEQRRAKRAEELYDRILLAQDNNDEETKLRNLNHLANLIIPDLHTLGRANRGRSFVKGSMSFANRPVQVKVDKYYYTIRFVNYKEPVEVDRKPAN